MLYNRIVFYFIIFYSCNLYSQSISQKGFVKDVCDFGSGDVLEVSLDDKESTIYIPFDRDNVSKIDLENRTIILTPLKGFLV